MPWLFALPSESLGPCWLPLNVMPAYPNCVHSAEITEWKLGGEMGAVAHSQRPRPHARLVSQVTVKCLSLPHYHCQPTTSIVLWARRTKAAKRQGGCVGVTHRWQFKRTIFASVSLPQSLHSAVNLDTWLLLKSELQLEQKVEGSSWLLGFDKWYACQGMWKFRNTKFIPPNWVHPLALSSSVGSLKVPLTTVAIIHFYRTAAAALTYAQPNRTGTRTRKN